ncbi:hypothetical protein OEZ85_004839 [Tetradesmus obliquus]|uniref:UDENN domain-containing protein n=1 Tax=Tetradesmus obliquus TaxID=3088 RepID=A0ABY8UG03_TETOB|nr:hypothetical protein OEZ85_004839 [Tetradesmus obliquus]
MNLAPLKTHVEPGSSSVGPAAGTWIIGICSVVFDIDVGQTLQHLHPENCLSEEEQSSVAFHAFPDSLSMELYTRNAIRDSSFQFRIKRIPASFTGGAPDFLYGYVFCRQRQDESLRRGGEQAAVVVLASVPLSSMLMPLSLVAGHAFFSEGEAALEQLVSQVAAWPPPVPGSRVSLPAGHAMISGQLPLFTLLPPPQPEVHPSVQATLARRAQRAASIRRGGAVDAAVVLQPLLRHAWTLWQLLITAQPLMVVGLTPRDTSAAVAALMGLIAPLPYAADYRPYFTIHDPDFVALSRGKLPQFGAYQEQLPAAAQDVTTPAVSKKEAVSRPASMGGINGSSGGNQQPEQRASSSSSLAAAAGSNTPDDSSSDQPAGSTTDSAAAPAAAAPRRAGLISSTAAAALRAYRRHQQGPQHLLSDFSPHLWSSCKPLIRPDASLIASVTAALEKEQQAAAGAIAGGLAGGPGGGLARSRSGVPAGAAGRQLRRHFGELTAAFLAPFQRYFEPGANGMVPRWCPQHFLASLKSAGLSPALAARLAGNAFASAAALYAAFIAGPNFAHWFGQQRRPVLHLVEPAAPEQDEVAEEGYDVLPDVQRQQQQQPADTAASSGSGSNSAGSSGSGGTSGSGSSNSADDEVARVQAFLGAEQDMLSVGEQQQQCELQARLVRTFTSLPRDLQLALISSPARRHLLDDVVAALQAGNNNSNGSSAATVCAGDKQHVAFGRGVDVLEGLQQLQQLMQELSVGSS